MINPLDKVSNKKIMAVIVLENQGMRKNFNALPPNKFNYQVKERAIESLSESILRKFFTSK